MKSRSSLFLEFFWDQLSSLRRRQFWIILILMLIASILEAMSIGAILPFLGVLIDPEQVYKNELLQPIIQILNIDSAKQLAFPLTIIFISIALVTGIIRLILLYTMNRFEQAIGSDLSIKIYQLTLYQDYSTHISRNSSDIINSIIGKTNIVVRGVLTSFLALLSSTIILVGIMSVLIFINTKVALLSFGIFGFIYWGIIHFTRYQLSKNSKSISIESAKMIKSLQEGLGGIRDVLINNSQQFYCNLYSSADIPLRRASANNSFINAAPRFLIEALGVTLIAGLAYLMSRQESSISNIIPVLGALALGAQRLLPVLQQIYRSISSVIGSFSSFEDVLELLKQPLPSYANQSSISPTYFNNKIIIDNMSFRYSSDSPWILKDISLTIKKGECAGIIGVTGSGKSTFIDIVMGLLLPTAGSLTVDKEIISMENCQNWRANIAHVSQDIYLSDTTIGENIAFGQFEVEIDYDRVKLAAQQACISKLIESWPEQYQTFVGERGVRLSGGQRQRIGIARALYRQASVLILDEATNSLDSQTENKVMNTIKELNKELTIIVITHRVSILKNCSKIIELGDKGILDVFNYNKLEK